MHLPRLCLQHRVPATEGAPGPQRRMDQGGTSSQAVTPEPTAGVEAAFPPSSALTLCQPLPPTCSPGLPDTCHVVSRASARPRSPARPPAAFGGTRSYRGPPGQGGQLPILTASRRDGTQAEMSFKEWTCFLNPFSSSCRLEPACGGGVLQPAWATGTRPSSARRPREPEDRRAACGVDSPSTDCF